MDWADRKIVENKLAVPLAKAVSQWMKANEVTTPVAIDAHVVFPSCYVDEQGVSHTGPVIMCNVEVMDDFDDDDE